MLPLALTLVPLDELLQRLLKIVFCSNSPRFHLGLSHTLNPTLKYRFHLIIGEPPTN
jgi:hypothetical protein